MEQSTRNEGQNVNTSEPQDDRERSSTQDAIGLSFVCSVCGRRFRRPENLKRHAGSHRKETRFSCAHCGKGFYRTDALQRHESVHQADGKRRTMRINHACASCALARVKCSGETPCNRCKAKGAECVYSKRRSIEQPQSQSTWSQSAPQKTQVNLNHTRRLSTQANLIEDDTLQRRLLANENLLPKDLSRTHLSTGQAENANSSHEEVVQNINTPEVSILSEHSVPEWNAIAMERSHTEQNLIESNAAPTFLSAQDGMIQSFGGMGTEYFGPSMLSSLNWLPPDFTFPGADDDLYGLQVSPQLVPGLPFDFQAPVFSFSNDPGSVESVAGASQYDGSQISYQSPSQYTRGNQSSPVDDTPRTPESDRRKGRFYVDGDGARLPRSARQMKSRSQITTQSPLSLEGAIYLAFPNLDHLAINEHENSVTTTDILNRRVYQEIAACFQKTCITSTVFHAFSSSHFPSLNIISRLIQLCIQHFVPIYPFLHLASLDLSKSDWLLSLGLAAVGSHYIEIDGFDAGAVAMHEFLRRAIISESEIDHSEESHDVLLAQVQCLNCIGLFYTLSNRPSRLALSSYNDLATRFNQQWFHSVTVSPEGNNDWVMWRLKEARRRLGYCIWLLDSMMVYHFNIKPRLTLDITISLPCEEQLWEARSAAEWRGLYGASMDSYPLDKALRMLYIEKRLPPRTGEFAKILLIHGLYRQTWDIGDSLQRPLSHWTPTADKQDSSILLEPVWLPRIEKFSSWRNSACDVLDVLHFLSNSLVATTSTENPTVHHLHFSRIVLLVPYQHILNLVMFTVGESGTTPEQDIRFDRQRVRRWVTEDQHKARLAMIHVGVLFWHVRRYSTGAFYEPANVFLATIAGWAYGSFAQLLGRQQRPERESSPSSSDSATLTSIRLDRPTDDELVQLFVRNGATMKATISGVGNLSGPKGPLKMLKEGRKLLSGLTNWGVAARYIQILTSLVSKYQALS